MTEQYPLLREDLSKILLILKKLSASDLLILLNWFNQEPLADNHFIEIIENELEFRKEWQN